MGMDINKVIMESIKDITHKEESVVTESAADVKIPKAGEKDPNYIPALRKAFNSLPNRGKNLRVSGKGQTPPPSRADQKLVDAAFKKEKDALDSKGVVSKVVEPVKSAAKGAGTKVGKAWDAVKGASGTALGKIKDNPKTSAAVAAALAAGTGAVVFRKKIAQAYKDAKKKLSEE